MLVPRLGWSRSLFLLLCLAATVVFLSTPHQKNVIHQNSLYVISNGGGSKTGEDRVRGDLWWDIAISGYGTGLLEGNNGLRIHQKPHPGRSVLGDTKNSKDLGQANIVISSPTTPKQSSQIAVVPRSAGQLDNASSSANVMKSNLFRSQTSNVKLNGSEVLAESMRRKEASLKDPWLRKIEHQRQEKYLEFLEMKKQYMRHMEGGELVSFASSPIRFPYTMKYRNPDEWSQTERVWVNVSHYLWPQDEQCTNFSVRFAKPHTFPKCGLASLPSSGNSWLRYLIEGATGFFTGSMYNDMTITRRGMYGESVIYNSSMTIVQKTHGYTTEKGLFVSRERQLSYSHMDELDHHAILVIRNPFKAIISHRHLDASGHMGHAPVSHFQGDKWYHFVKAKALLWKNFYSDWLKNCKAEDILVVFYENVKENISHELRKILGFLKMDVNEKRLECVAHHPDGNFKRRPTKYSIQNPYTSEEKEIVYRAIQELNTVLENYGRETLPIHLYELYNEDEAKIFT